MTVSRSVKLFRNGRNQAVRIPREFELPGEDAVMLREGDRLIIELPKRMGLLALLDTFDDLEDGLGEIEDSPPEIVDF